MTIESIRELIAADLDAVNTSIITAIQDEIGLIDDLSHHIVNSGGKRLRPMLVLLASRACGYEGNEHITLAAMIEFFHTATLLHDDVVDESTLRRGKKTANEIWGSKASILVGDFLFTQSVKFLVSINHKGIFDLMANTSHEITRGEIKQLMNRHNVSLSTSDYFDVIRAKTAVLFAASSATGGLIQNQPQPIVDALYQYGLHLGNAFQLIDDILDYCGDTETIGKNIGDDLADGKLTLPIIHALENAKEIDQFTIKDSFTKGDRSRINAIIEIIQKTNALNMTRETAQNEVNLAKEALNLLPESPYKDALYFLTDYALERVH